MSTIGVKSCGSSLARSEGSEEPKMVGPDWFQIEAFFNYIPYSNRAFFVSGKLGAISDGFRVEKNKFIILQQTFHKLMQMLQKYTIALIYQGWIACRIVQASGKLLNLSSRFTKKWKLSSRLRQNREIVEAAFQRVWKL